MAVHRYSKIRWLAVSDVMTILSCESGPAKERNHGSLQLTSLEVGVHDSDWAFILFLKRLDFLIRLTFYGGKYVLTSGLCHLREDLPSSRPTPRVLTDIPAIIPSKHQASRFIDVGVFKGPSNEVCGLELPNLTA